MIGLSNFEHFLDAQAFAIKVNKLESLNAVMLRVAELAHENESVIINKDFARYSFGFVIANHVTNEVRMNGGIIFHGQLENGTYEETFSIQLSPSDGWDIHT